MKHMVTNLLEQLDARIAEVLPAVTELRRDLHQHPELAMQEFRTSKCIREWLAASGMSPWEPLLETDVVAELSGSSPRVMCLRADIDAVPGEEESTLPYRSEYPGAMHACGHDAHTAILAGAARVLACWPEPLRATVRFIFQPGEEVRVAGKDLVEQGACRDATMVYALHDWHGMPLGSFGSREGILFAAGCMFTITVTGQGCHGAMPEMGINPLPIAARIITELYAMHGREQASTGSVITTCMAHAGMSPNVIPVTAELQGTARYLTAETGERIRREIAQQVELIAQQAGATASVEFFGRYDLPLVNTAAGYRQVRAIVERYFAPGSWHEVPTTMGTEDFAYYLPGREGAMVRLGVGEDAPPLHSPRFNFPDAALSAGIKFFCLLALTAGGAEL